MIRDNSIEWLCLWYKNNCNGDWEHYYGISIETIDNPGWSITIDIEGTEINIPDINWQFFENGPDDWYGYKLENGKFEASGDPNKLEFIISLFKDLIGP